RHSLEMICQHLNIKTRIVVSSTIAIDHSLKGQEKVIALCEALGGETYINPIGGTDLYAKEDFRARGIELKFIRSRDISYEQFGHPHVPWLSIVDVLMFNSRDEVRERLLAQWEYAR